MDKKQLVIKLADCCAKTALVANKRGHDELVVGGLCLQSINVNTTHSSVSDAFENVGDDGNVDDADSSKNFTKNMEYCFKELNFLFYIFLNYYFTPFIERHYINY